MNTEQSGNRATLFKAFRTWFDDDEGWYEVYKDYTAWENINFSSDESVKVIFAKSIDAELFKGSLSKFYIDYVCDLVEDATDKSVWTKGVVYCKSAKPQTSDEWFKEKQGDGYFKEVTGQKYLTTTKGGKSVYVDNVTDGDLTYYYGPDKNGKLYYIRYEGKDKNKVFKGEYDVEYTEDFDQNNSTIEDIPESFVIRCLKLIRETNKDIISEQRKKPGTEVPYNSPTAQSGGQVQDEINTIRNRYFLGGLKLDDESKMRTLVTQMENLVGQGYIGYQFENIYKLLKLKSSIPSPNQSWQKELLGSVADLRDTDELKFQNPTQDDMNTGEVEAYIPPIWDKIIKPKEPIFYKQTGKTVYDKENCKAYMDEYYDAFQKGFETGGKAWCKTPKARYQRKRILNCKNQGKLGIFRGGRKFEDLMAGRVGGYEYPECAINYGEK